MERALVDRSLGLDVRSPDHLAPFLGFIGDELAEVGGRERENVASQVGEPRLDFGIGEAGIDLLVQPFDDFGGRVAGRTKAVKVARLIARPRSEYPAAPANASPW
jgi:hypothetical protein